MKLTEPEAMEWFASARVARLATVDASGHPHLVPVTFALCETAIVFAVDHKPKATTDLKRLRNIAANPAVSWLVDHYDEDWTRLWWVRADGTAALIEDPARREAPVRALQEKYPQYTRQAPHGPVVSTRVHAWRGWAARSPA